MKNSRNLFARGVKNHHQHFYVVDAADADNLSTSRNELHDLLSKPSLIGIPLLVIGNKIDKPGALSKLPLTDQMQLKRISDREVFCLMISCKDSTNIDSVLDCLLKHSRSYYCTAFFF